MSRKPAVADAPRGRVAAVTGAASGIGKASAERLARDGFTIAVLDRNEDGVGEVVEAIRAENGAAFGRMVDVSSPEQVMDTFSWIASDLGDLYALINSAGILSISPMLELSHEDWQRVIDVDLTGTFLCSQAGARAMIAVGQGGRIVNIASVHSTAPGRGLAHYDSAKGGVWMLTRNLALELAPHGIGVNAIGPGLVLTNLAGAPNQEYLDEVVPAIPMGRPGQPDDIAGPVSFLCSGDAGYVTGAMLFVDGGMLLTART
jgi:NAD(P)-dependent dehydrogenase (short-subunit alcohol dehydrogenase family)